MLAEDNRVMARFTLKGAITELHRGLPEPTGKRGVMRAIFVFRIADGRILEMRGGADRMRLFAQHGLLPDIGQGDRMVSRFPIAVACDP